MKDRFTEASSELTEKNPYICDSCETMYGHPTIETQGEMVKHELDPMAVECIFNCDPRPFGD